MSYEQFWYGDVEMTQAYMKAFEIEEKRKSKIKKWTIWEQGLYIYEALCDVSPIFRAFSKAKKPLPYASKPYGIDETEENKEEIKKKKEQNDLARAQIFFKNWARATEKHFKKEGKK